MKNKSTTYQILFWGSIWILINMLLSGFDFSSRMWVRGIVSSFAVIVMVYINLEILLPKLFFKKKYALYIISCLLCMLLFAVIIRLDFMPWAEYFESTRRGPPRPHSPATQLRITTFRYLSTVTPMLISLIGSSLFAIASFATRKEKEMSLLRSEKLESELKFLKSQTNPHFLFNALNNIYTLSLMKSDETPDNLLKLSGMLRYMLYECKAEKVPLSKEIEYIKNYVDLYRLKDSEGLNIDLELDESKPHLMVGPLLFVPFIENAFKHSKVEDLEKGWIKVNLKVEGQSVHFTVKNSLPKEGIQKDGVGGIGLQNSKRQLQLMYPDKHELEVNEKEDSFEIKMKLDLA